MPEMGDLLQGYLYRKQAIEEEKLAQEEKKRQKLEEQLTELDFIKTQRELDRMAEDWKRQKEKSKRQEEWYRGLGDLTPEEIKEILYGIKQKEPLEPEEPSKFEETYQNILRGLQMPGAEFTTPESPALLRKQAYGQALKQEYPKAFETPKETTKEADYLKELENKYFGGEGLDEEGSVRNKTNKVAENLLMRIRRGEFDRAYLQNYIDENADEYRKRGVDPDLLKQSIGR